MANCSINNGVDPKDHKLKDMAASSDSQILAKGLAQEQRKSPAGEVHSRDPSSPAYYTDHGPLGAPHKKRQKLATHTHCSPPSTGILRQAEPF